MLYLLHATKSLGGTGRASASHYLGWSTPAQVKYRIAEHQHGTGGTAITRAFHQIGATLHVVWVRWDGTRAEESYLKRQGQIKRLCPICNPGRRTHRYPNEWYARHLGDRMPDAPGTRQQQETTGARSPGSQISTAGTSPAGPIPISRIPLDGYPMVQSECGPIGSNAPALRPRKEHI